MADKETITLGDVFAVMLPTQNAAGPKNADSTPIWEVEDTSDDSVVLNGVFGLKSGKVGEYTALITMSASNGISAGSVYRVVARATVGGVDGVIEKALLSVISSASDPSTPPAFPTTNQEWLDYYKTKYMEVEAAITNAMTAQRYRTGGNEEIQRGTLSELRKERDLLLKKIEEYEVIVAQGQEPNRSYTLGRRRPGGIWV